MDKVIKEVAYHGPFFVIYLMAIIPT